MLGKKLALLLLCILPSVIVCWKPIGSPTTFSVQHPQFASESLKSNNELLQQDASAENIITTYHGNQAYSIPSREHVSFLPEDHVEHVVDHSEHLGLGSSEGRIINAKSLYFPHEFDQNNGLYKDVSNGLENHQNSKKNLKTFIKKNIGLRLFKLLQPNFH